MNSDSPGNAPPARAAESAPSLDIVLPVFNESLDVVLETIQTIRETFAQQPGVTIIVVDDGSDEEYGLKALRQQKDLIFLQHVRNMGYGAALKTGILSGTGSRIAITDSDGTYPVAELGSMLKEMDSHDMVVATRTGKVRQIPWMRRFPKWVLNLFASYFAGVRIVDLNSGLRIFTRDLCYYLWDFFPRRFSFTSTITMGAIMGGFRIKELPVNYYQRTGKSSIRPIRDTLRFFKIIAKIGLIFYPMKLFGPVAAAMFLTGFVKGVLIDYFQLGYVGTMAAVLMIASVQVFMLGLIGELIVHSRFAHSRPKALPDLADD